MADYAALDDVVNALTNGARRICLSCGCLLVQGDRAWWRPGGYWMCMPCYEETMRVAAQTEPTSAVEIKTA